MDRREFLMAGAAGAALTFAGAAGGQVPPPRQRGAGAIWVDAQGAIDGFDEISPGKYAPGAKLVQAIRERRIDLVSMTVGEVGNGPDRFKSGVEAIAMFDRMIAEHSGLVAKVESAADIRAARAAGKLGL